MSIIMPLPVSLRSTGAVIAAASGPTVGRDPFRSGPIAAQEFGRVTPVEGRLVEECGTRRDECRCTRRIRVNGACSIDQIQPRPREGHVELLGLAVSRGQPLDSGSQAPEGFVASIARQVHDRQVHVVGVMKLGERCTLEAFHQLIVRDHAVILSCRYRDGPLPKFCHAFQPSLRIGRATATLSALQSIEGESVGALRSRIGGVSAVQERRHEVVSKLRQSHLRIQRPVSLRREHRTGVDLRCAAVPASRDRPSDQGVGDRRVAAGDCGVQGHPGGCPAHDHEVAARNDRSKKRLDKSAKATTRPTRPK